MSENEEFVTKDDLIALKNEILESFKEASGLLGDARESCDSVENEEVITQVARAIDSIADEKGTILEKITINNLKKARVMLNGPRDGKKKYVLTPSNAVVSSIATSRESFVERKLKQEARREHLYLLEKFKRMKDGWSYEGKAVNAASFITALYIHTSLRLEFYSTLLLLLDTPRGDFDAANVGEDFVFVVELLEGESAETLVPLVRSWATVMLRQEGVEAAMMRASATMSTGLTDRVGFARGCAGFDEEGSAEEYALSRYIKRQTTQRSILGGHGGNGKRPSPTAPIQPGFPTNRTPGYDPSKARTPLNTPFQPYKRGNQPFRGNAPQTTKQ